MATLPKPLPKSKLASQSSSDSKSLPPALKLRAQPERSVAASNAKMHLLKLLDTVDHTRSSIIFTKRGRPVAKLVPIEDAAPRRIFGWIKGSGNIIGEIVGPESDIWSAMVE